MRTLKDEIRMSVTFLKKGVDVCEEELFRIIDNDKNTEKLCWFLLERHDNGHLECLQDAMWDFIRDPESCCWVEDVVEFLSFMQDLQFKNDYLELYSLDGHLNYTGDGDRVLSSKHLVEILGIEKIGKD